MAAVLACVYLIVYVNVYFHFHTQSSWRSFDFRRNMKTKTNTNTSNTFPAFRSKQNSRTTRSSQTRLIHPPTNIFRCHCILNSLHAPMQGHFIMQTHMIARTYTLLEEATKRTLFPQFDSFCGRRSTPFAIIIFCIDFHKNLHQFMRLRLKQ